MKNKSRTRNCRKTCCEPASRAAPGGFAGPRGRQQPGSSIAENMMVPAPRGPGSALIPTLFDPEMDFKLACLPNIQDERHEDEHHYVPPIFREITLAWGY
jgi:hypothetical protein